MAETPKNPDEETDFFFAADSPLGTIYVVFGEAGIKYATTDPASDEEFVRHYGETFGRLAVPADGDEDIIQKTSAALAGEGVELDLELSEMTDFQRRVVEAVRRIPRGEVRPYGWVAKEAGSPGASRAVGSVMANNPLSLIVPCHRVIRNDGSLGKYGSHPERKSRLLEREGVAVDEISRSPYFANAETKILCHATCREARSAKTGDLRPFRSVPAALDAGFRPCRTCRPVARGASG